MINIIFDFFQYIAAWIFRYCDLGKFADYLKPMILVSLNSGLDASPAEYMKDQLAKIPPDEKADVYAYHALPDDWEKMEYDAFFKQRRILMAKVIKRGYERLI